MQPGLKENNKKKKEIGGPELISFLRQIDESLPSRIKLIAIGGTALTLLNLKDSTKDIDFTSPPGDFEIIEQTFTKSGFSKIGDRWMAPDFIIDLYKGNNIFSTMLMDDYLEKSKRIEGTGFKKIELYTLFSYDLIITKTARLNDRDIEDIKSIFLNLNIDQQKLISRYKKTVEISHFPHAKYSISLILKTFLQKWGIKANSKALKAAEEMDDE